MDRFKKPLSISFFVLCLTLCVGFGLFFQRCGGGATETGNPLGFTAFRIIQTIQIQNAMCSKLTQCFFNVDFYQCTLEISRVTNIDTELGLNAGIYQDYQEIIDAEESNNLFPNDNAASQCIDDIHILGCNSTEVQMAYNPNTPDDFDQVFNLLATDSGSCPDVF
jgi:hypothetical protein